MSCFYSEGGAACAGEPVSRVEVRVCSRIVDRIDSCEDHFAVAYQIGVMDLGADEMRVEYLLRSLRRPLRERVWHALEGWLWEHRFPGSEFLRVRVMRSD